MRAIVVGGTAFSVLMGGAAMAQQGQGDPGQQQRHDQMLQTVPGKNGKEEPSAHMPSSSNDVFVNGSLTVPGAPTDTQTTPAKFSERNARLDAYPTMALPLKLDDAQKQRIMEIVAKSGTSTVAIASKPAEELPFDVEMQELPPELADVPDIRGLKYVKVRDGVLLVSPATRIVVGRIPG